MAKFDWKKFSNVGDHLVKFSNDEEYQRSAVGRYYYACFGLTKDYYESTHHVTIPTKESHNTLIKKLEDSCYDKENELGSLLKDLRRYRNSADYYNTFDRRNVRNSQKQSHDLIVLIEDLRKHPIVPQF